jgi:hypothetical protein
MLILRSEFFYGMTPFAIGGQPYQLYELKNKDDISYAHGTNIVFKDCYGYQLALVTVSTIFLSLNYIFKIIQFNDVIKKLLLVGYLVNIGIVIFFEYLKYSKLKHNKIVNSIINLLYKIRIIKNKEKISEKINNGLERNRENLKEKDFNLVLKSYLFSILKLLMLGLAGYLSLKATYINNVNIIEGVFIIIFAMNVSSFIPTPGASGGMEFGFLTLLSSFIVGAKANAAMLLWRFSGFYFLTLNGALMIMLKERFEKRKEINNEKNSNS